MSLYKHCPPPIRKINGIPAYKAGEWPGLKSNKFPNTKKIILVENHKIFFDTKDTLPIPKKKYFNSCSTEEWTFKPGTKRVKPIIKQEKKLLFTEQFPLKSDKETKIFNCSMINIMMKKEYDFERRDNYYKKKEKEFNRKVNESLLMNKNKSTTFFEPKINIRQNLVGKSLTKEFYQNISNNKVLGVDFNKDIHNLMKNKKELTRLKKVRKKIEKKRNKSMLILERFKESKKIMEEMTRKENYEKDIHYVLSLDNWKPKLPK